MTQDDYVVMKRSSREKLIRELKECKKENQQLKKQKEDVVEYIKKRINYLHEVGTEVECCEDELIFLLRILGEIDE